MDKKLLDAIEEDSMKIQVTAEEEAKILGKIPEIEAVELTDDECFEALGYFL